MPGYLAGWVHRRICQELEAFSAAVARGESPRLMLWMPPRHGKSKIASERFPVWHLGQYPEHEVAVASYSQRLANGFSKRGRALARDRHLKHYFPNLELDPDKQAVEEWQTLAGGGYKAVGVGGSFTGTGCHILIIDDPHKDRKEADSQVMRDNVWEWYTDTAATRLAPGGGIIVIMTRWHEDDLAGRLLKAAEAEDEHAEQWKVLSFPAIAEEDEVWEERVVRKAGEPLHPERYNLPALQRIKARNYRTWLALYQQRPTAQEGNILKRDKWRFWKVLPEFEYVVGSVDAAFKDSDGSDYVAVQVWGKVGSRLYLLDQVRDRMGFRATKQAILAMRRRWPDMLTVFIEEAANGAAIIDELTNGEHAIPGIVPVKPLGGKVARAQVTADYLEAGNLYLPDPKYVEGADWVYEYIEESASFPRGANDDQVDATSQAVAQLGRYEEFEPEGASY